MPDPISIDRRAFNRTRRSIDRTESRLRGNAARMVDAADARTGLIELGADATRLARTETRIADLELERRDLMVSLIEERARFIDLSDGLVARRSPEQLVAGLDGRVPVALLPVRLETRFFNRGSQLKIRIFPDQIHLDSHEDGLTDDELADGQRYWNARWEAPDAEARQAAWGELARAHGEPRARWIAEQLTPVNLDEAGADEPELPTVASREGPWTEPVRAKALPDRWVALGFRHGQEVFRKWGRAVPDTLATSPTPDPTQDPDEPDPATDGEEGVLIDEPMRWVVDYDVAESVGMAITVDNSDMASSGPFGRVGALNRGFDRLVVLGVDWTLDPSASAGRLEDLFSGHRFSDGLEFVAQGTATNNTRDDRSGFTSDDRAGTDTSDPSAVSAELAADSAARQLTAALGLGVASLDSTPGADLSEARTAGLLHDVLWASTLGHYLDEVLDPMLDDTAVSLVRDHVANWLRPSGPYGVLRIGRQPYGILPCLAPESFAPDRPNGLESGLMSVLDRFRPIWEDATKRLPQMGATDDPDTELLELLQASPLAEVSRFRKVYGPGSVENTDGLGGVSLMQTWGYWFLWAYFGTDEHPFIGQLTTDPEDHPLPVPWVQPGALSEGDPLVPNYLASIAQTAAALGGRNTLNEQVDANTLLEALVAQAAVEELDASISRYVSDIRVGLGDLEASHNKRNFRSAEMIGITEPVAAVDPRRGAITISTPTQQANMVIPSETGTITAADFVVNLLADADTRERPEVRNLTTFLDALGDLADQPALEIERAFRGWLDATSHRLDTWYTSLATRRIDTLRDDGRTGIYLGGFGMVENLRPATTPASLGYIHAPSLNHAATAAILRSGHLAHHDDERDALDINLTSDRVQRALPMVEGIAAGQQLAALLGYRFERSVRDHDVRLARFILPIRRLAPLYAEGAELGDGPVEAIAARDVVDGVRLLDRWREERATLLNGIGASSAQKADLRGRLDDLDALFDAVADLLMAESVHQTVLGNYERASAALAALDRQERPPDLDLIRTPRTGTVYTQRVAAVFSTPRVPPAWSGVRRDQRAQAEPRANAWIASLLPPASQISFAGRLVPAEGPSHDLSVPVSALRMSPLSLVLAGAGGSAGQRSELEERIAAALTAAASGIDVGEATLEILDEPPASAGAGVIGLGVTRSLLEWIRALLAESRSATANDFTPPREGDQPGVDVAELERRADGAVADLREARIRLATVVGSSSSNARSLRAAADRASELGVGGVAPAPVGATPTERAVSARAHAEAVLRQIEARAQELVDLEQALSSEPTDEDLVAHHTARLHVVFGQQFPVFPVFRLGPPADRRAAVEASLVDQPALTAGDPLVTRAWIDQMAMVRPETDKLARVLGASELLGSEAAGPESMQIVQLPHKDGQQWIGTPASTEPVPDADLAIVIHAPVPFRGSTAISGLICDEWQETVPSDTETTGVSFHYDAPGARAPQSVLLAVPPKTDETAWDFEVLLDTVLEAMDLARVRGVAPKHLRWVGGLLPTVYLPDNFTRDRPSIDLFGMAQPYLQAIKYTGVVGKGGS